MRACRPNSSRLFLLAALERIRSSPSSASTPIQRHPSPARTRTAAGSRLAVGGLRSPDAGMAPRRRSEDAAAARSPARSRQRPPPGAARALVHAAQLRRRPLPVPDPDRAAHRPRPLPRPHDGDAPERDPLHDGPGIDSREPRPPHGDARPAEPLRRRRVRQGRPAQRHRISRPHALLRAHARHGRRRDEPRARRLALRQAAGRRTPS